MNQACVAASEFRAERDALAARVARLEEAALALCKTLRRYHDGPYECDSAEHADLEYLLAALAHPSGDGVKAEG
jgi:exonuclease VII small subunit